MHRFYKIKVKGHFELPWSDWFSGLELVNLEGDETLLSGYLVDQAALFGLLKRIRDLNLVLISMTSSSHLPPQITKGDNDEEN